MLMSMNPHESDHSPHISILFQRCNRTWDFEKMLTSCVVESGLSGMSMGFKRQYRDLTVADTCSVRCKGGASRKGWKSIGLPRGRLSSMTIRFASDLLSWLHSLFQDKWHDPRPGCRLLYIAHKGDHLSLFLSFSFPLFFLSGVLTQLVRSRCHFEKVCKEEKANPDGEELPSLEPRAIR